VLVTLIIVILGRDKIMGIGASCEKSVRAAKLALAAQNEVNEYCNNYAKKLLGRPDFELLVLPDEITEAVFYGHGSAPENGWAEFLKASIRTHIDRINTFGGR
jgi:hypothetical protein